MVECGIEVRSGVLTLHAPESAGLPDNPTINVLRGFYRALVFWGGIDTIPDDEGFEGDDHYRIVLWPGEIIAPIVHKRYSWPE